MNMKKMIISIILMIFMTSEGVSQIDSTKYKNPKLAITFSALCPGGGQIYNEQWIKAGIIMGIDGLWIYKALQYQDLYLENPDKEYNENSRNKYIWYSAGGYLFGIIDAYVDAHLSGFPVENIVFYGDENNYKLSLTIRF